MSLMVDSESSVGGGDEDLFLKRHHVRRIPLLISYNRIKVNEISSCGRINNLATSEVVV